MGFVVIDQVVEAQRGPSGGPVSEADIGSAISPSYLLDVTTGHITITERNGLAQTQRTANSFWAESGITGNSNAFEARALFDISSQRWFMTADEHISGPNRRYIAVSETDDPRGAWHALQLPTDGVVLETQLAVDKNGVYVTGQRDTGGSLLVAIPVADLLAPAPITSRAKEFEIALDHAIPASDPDVDKMADAPAFIAARSGNREIDLFRVTWDSTATPTLAAALPVDLNGEITPPPAMVVQPEPGDAIAVGGNTIRSAQSLRNIVYGVVLSEVGGRSTPVWFQLDGTLGFAYVASPIAVGDTDVVAPALAIGTSGEIGFVGTAVSSTLAPTPVISGQGFDGGFAQVAFPQVGVGAPAPYTCATGGFGRTSSIGFDAVDRRFWSDSQYGGFSTDCEFTTTWVQSETLSDGLRDDFFPIDDGGFGDDDDDQPLRGDHAYCSGCQSSSPAGLGSGAFLVAGVALLLRRRRQPQR